MSAEARIAETDPAYIDAKNREWQLEVTADRSAEALLDAVAALGWGSGIPWFDAIGRLGRAAERRGYPVPVSDPATDQRTGRHAIPRWVVRAVWDRDGWECRHCQSHQGLSIDHIVPVAGDGLNNPANFQTLCLSCNSKKRDRPEVTP